MTANIDRKPTLEAVLDEIAGSPVVPNETLLRAWTTQYPEFASQIVAFVTDWIAMDVASTPHDVTDEDVSLVLNRTMSRVQGILDAGERSEQLTDLATDIRAAGYDFDTFQRAAGIDRSILDSLIARLVKASTIPHPLVRDTAELLNRSLDNVRNYFRLPPQAVGAYKSRAQPEIKQVDFAMLLEHSKLSDKERVRWRNAPLDPVLRE
jgi:hypothetical protein